MTDTGFAQKAIYRVHIDAPIETVWSELVKTDAALPFFFGAVCDTPGLQEGAPIAMRTKDGKHTSVVGTVLEFEPPHRYAHTFKFTHLDEAPCVVTYELRSVDGGTEFSLITENVPMGTKTAKSMAQGGPFIVNNLKSVVERGKPTFGGGLILTMIGLMAPLTPAACASQRWTYDDITRAS